MRAAILGAGLALASCAHDNPSVAFKVYDTRTSAHEGAGPDLEVLDQACEFWGIECYTAEYRGGAVLLILTDGPAWREGPTGLEVTRGLAVEKSCNPVVWSEGSWRVVAHELGHALGNLDDRPNGGQGEGANIMTEDASGDAASGAQRAAVAAGADGLSLCPGGVRP